MAGLYGKKGKSYNMHSLSGWLILCFAMFDEIEQHPTVVTSLETGQNCMKTNCTKTNLQGGSFLHESKIK